MLRFLAQGIWVLGAATVLFPVSAQASRFTLLGLSGLHQSAELSYNFNDNQSETKSTTNRSTNNDFSETYTIGAGYSILHPRLLRGDANISLSSNQTLVNNTAEGGSTGTNMRISYDVNGIILDRMNYPFNFSVSSSTGTVRPPFSRAYTLDMESQNVSFSIPNGQLPITVTYSRNASTTHGLADDIDQTSQAASISFRNSVDDLSKTRLSFTQSFDRQTLLGSERTDNRNAIVVNIANTLFWKNIQGLQRQIDSMYVYNEQSGSYPELQSSVASTLNWQIGKALDSKLAYVKSRNTDVHNNNDQQSISGSLSQKYLKCLLTTVGGSLAQGSYNDGSDRTASWNGRVAYTNELPRESSVRLDYGYQYVIQERKRSDVNLANVEKTTLSGPFPLFLDLAAHNIDSGTIAIFKDAAMTIRFSDFSTVFSGFQTRLLINSDPGVPFVYISYSYRQSPNITFATAGHTVGGKLSLLDKKCVLHANYSYSDSRILAGSDPSSTIGANTHIDAGIDGLLGRHTLSLEYSLNKSVFQRLQQVETNWIHTLQAAKASLLTKANDRYSWYENTSIGTSSTQGWDNTFLLSTAYSRVITPNLRGKATLGYFNMITSSVVSNRFSIELGLEGNFGRTVVTLDSSANWGFSPSSYSHSQTVNLKLRRIF
ncbi:hypothetical protein F6V30_14685 [Oryzomonas sagensis]|uniref:TIGR03016 family PEP-CTERM system-associated outer membrane protein n=1 Tax=Oryzomonas sagensis TaxID=2603857 RepID=A0ABQ6TLF8_9BACT|nr:hypothetical protein [Oryzomonas sagensis]KAB0669073.1 hypothetical protein F6V30_14685 [Oryzomonas sagensis]